MYNFVSLSLFLLLLMVITTWPTFNDLLFRQKQASFSKSWTIIFQTLKKKIYSAFWLLWDFSAIFIDFCSIWSWYLIWNLYHKNTKLHISIEHDLDTFFEFGIYLQIFSHFQRLIFFLLFSITIDFDTNDFIKQIWAQDCPRVTWGKTVEEFNL